MNGEPIPTMTEAEVRAWEIAMTSHVSSDEPGRCEQCGHRHQMRDGALRRWRYCDVCPCSLEQPLLRERKPLGPRPKQKGK